MCVGSLCIQPPRKTLGLLRPYLEGTATRVIPHEEAALLAAAFTAVVASTAFDIRRDGKPSKALEYALAAVTAGDFPDGDNDSWQQHIMRERIVESAHQANA